MKNDEECKDERMKNEHEIVIEIAHNDDEYEMNMTKRMNMIKNDDYLEPYKDELMKIEHEIEITQESNKK